MESLNRRGFLRVAALAGVNWLTPVGHLLARAGILSDHVHLALGCGIEESPLQVALGYLNNLAYAQGMTAVYQFGFYVGTFGEYDWGAIRRHLPG